MMFNVVLTKPASIFALLMRCAGLGCIAGAVACADAEVQSPELEVSLSNAHMAATVAPDPSVGFDVTVTCTNTGAAAGVVVVTDLGFSFKDDGGWWMGAERALVKSTGPISPGETVEIPYTTGVFGEGTPGLDCSWAPEVVTLLLEVEIGGAAAVMQVEADYECTDTYEP